MKNTEEQSPEIIVHDLIGLYEIRNQKSKHKKITWNTTKIYNGLELVYFLRLCKFILVDGGVLIINYHTKFYPLPEIANISSSIFRALCFKCQDSNFTITDVDEHMIVFTKVRPKPFSLSLYILSSGGGGEDIFLLDNALSWVNSAKNIELDLKITVVGPSSAFNKNKLLSNGINYINYDEVSVFDRFNIARKKNFCIDDCSTEYIAIAHSRVSCDKSFFEKIPKEFDVLTGRMFYRNLGLNYDYLDLTLHKFDSIKAFFNGPFIPFVYNRKKWIKWIGNYFPMVDGAFFIIDKELFRNISFDENIAWGESEDLFWSNRILEASRIIEIQCDAILYSSTYKLNQKYLKYKKIYIWLVWIKFCLLRPFFFVLR